MEETFLDNDIDFQTSAEMLSLDNSLLKAAMQMKLMYPSLVQSKLFEIFPDREHIVIKSKSRSGKSTGSIFLLAHKLIQSIKANKKENHYGIILCPNKAVCNSNQETLEKIISIASSDFGISCVNLANTSADVFKNELYVEAKKRLVIIATPLQLQNVLGNIQGHKLFIQKVRALFLDELNFMFSFGYETDLQNLLAHFKEVAPKMSITFSLSSEDDRFKALKSQIMTNGATLRFDDDFEEDDPTAGKETFYNEYFYVADDLTKSICLYCLFKLRLVAGRTLIICENVDEAYKFSAFLQRAMVPKVKVYNPTWPLKVK